MQPKFAFIDETGIAEGANVPQPFFGVGFLKVDDASAITERLLQHNFNSTSSLKSKRKQLLKELTDSSRPITKDEAVLLMASTHHNEYKFSSLCHDNLLRYQSFIDVLFSFPIYFCSLVINKTDPLFNAQIYGNYWDAYVKYSKLLAEKNCVTQEKLCIIADYMAKPKNSVKNFEQEMMRCQNVFNVIRAHSLAFPLIQACDILLGATVFQWKESRGLNGNSRHVEAKRLFLKHIISKMKIPVAKQNSFPFAQSITVHNPIYFSVWPLRLT